MAITDMDTVDSTTIHGRTTTIGVVTEVIMADITEAIGETIMDTEWDIHIMATDMVLTTDSTMDTIMATTMAMAVVQQ